MNKDEFKLSLKHPGYRDLINFVDEYASYMNARGYSTSYKTSKTSEEPTDITLIIKPGDTVKVHDPNYYTYSGRNWSDDVIPNFKAILQEKADTTHNFLISHYRWTYSHPNPDEHATLTIMLYDRYYE